MAVAESALQASDVDQSKHMTEAQAAEKPRRFSEDRKRDAIVEREVITLRLKDLSNDEHNNDI